MFGCEKKTFTSLVVSSLLILFVMALFAASSDAQTGDKDAGSPSETPTPKPKSDPITEEEREEQVEILQRRPGEKTADGIEGRALILGMKVRESDNHLIKVTEVAPSTPAFEAGVRDGDELISFDGFKAESYREWIDGIRKITTDAKDGDKLPLEIVRAGKKMDLRIRIPESKADELRKVVRQQPGQSGYAQEGTQPGQAPATVPGSPGAGYAGGGGVFGGDSSIFEDGPNSGAANDAVGRAVAHLMRVGGGTQPDSGAAPSDGRATGAAASIGSNSASAQGNPNPQPPRVPFSTEGNNPAESNNQLPGATPANQNPNNNFIPRKTFPAGGNGANGPAGAGGRGTGQGAKNLQQPLKQQLPAGLLAQVSGQQNQAGQQNRGPGQQNPDVPGTPAGGQVNPPSADPGAAAGAGGRVGIAGFQNTEQGMMVIVEVGGLAPGRYQVGIGDPSAIQGAAAANGTNQTGVDVPPNQFRNRSRGQGGRVGDPVQGNENPAPPRVPFPGEGNQPPATTPNAPNGDNNFIPRKLFPAGKSNAPGAGGAGNSGQGAKNLQQPLKQQLPPKLLAQVAGQQNGAQPPAAATGQGNQRRQAAPSVSPPAGSVNPLGATATGQSRVNNQAQNQIQNGTDSQPGTSQTGTDGQNGGVPSQIGTLRVDRSGIGRMRQTVEGVQVRDVVGQALVIFGTEQNLATGPNQGEDGQQPVAGGTRDAFNPRQQDGNQVTGSMPVAAGVIQFVSDQSNGSTGNATNTGPLETGDGFPNEVPPSPGDPSSTRGVQQTKDQPTGVALPPPASPRR